MSDMHGTAPTVVGNADNVSSEHLFAVSFGGSNCGDDAAKREEFKKDYLANRIERLVDLRAFDGSPFTLHPSPSTSPFTLTLQPSTFNLTLHPPPSPSPPPSPLTLHPHPSTLFATATTSASSTFDEDELEKAYYPCLEVVPVGHVPIFKPNTTSATARTSGTGGGFEQLRASARASVPARTAIDDAMNAVSRCRVLRP
jgi:hypothetical protein